MIIKINKKNVAQYIAYLRNSVKDNQEIVVADRQEDSFDNEIDFEWTMEACIVDLRHRMHHDHQKA